MQLYNAIHQDSLMSEINRLCGTTANSYSYKDKVARINQGLDRYFELAQECQAIAPFDDSNRTSAPIETQNLVSGTNTYKFSAFTNEVLGVAKICVLNSDGEEFTLNHLLNVNFDNIGQDFSTSTTGIPTDWWRFGDYIYLNPTPDYNYTSGLRVYADRVLSRFNWVTFTVTAATDLINSTAHGLSANDIIIAETDNTIPAGMSVNTPYYVISSGLTADAYKASATLGGSTIDITDTGTGNHQYLKINGSPGIPTIHHLFLAHFASLPYCVENDLKRQNAIASLIQQDEAKIRKYFAIRDKDLRKKITFKQRAYK